MKKERAFSHIEDFWARIMRPKKAKETQPLGCVYVYFREGKLFIQVSDLTETGLWQDRDEVMVFNAKVPDDTLGSKVIAMLSTSRLHVPNDFKDSHTLYRAAGVKTEKTFQRGAQMVSVCLKDGKASITPFKNLGVGWGSFDDERDEVTIFDGIPPADTLGATIRAVLGRATGERLPDPAGKLVGPSPEDDNLPVTFGFRASWIAVRSEDPKTVATGLDLRDVAPATWSVGVESAIEACPRESVFVTPPISGWVLAVGLLPDPCNGDEELEVWRDLMHELSKTFGEAQYFASHRVSSYSAWAKYVGGEPIRLFAWAEETIFNEGAPTPEEEDLVASFWDDDDPDSDGRPPEEDDVLTVAKRWSVSPMELEDTSLGSGMGLLGRPRS